MNGKRQLGQCRISLLDIQAGVSNFILQIVAGSPRVLFSSAYSTAGPSTFHRVLTPESWDLHQRDIHDAREVTECAVLQALDLGFLQVPLLGETFIQNRRSSVRQDLKTEDKNASWQPSSLDYMQVMSVLRSPSCVVTYC